MKEGRDPPTQGHGDLGWGWGCLGGGRRWGAWFLAARLLGFKEPPSLPQSLARGGALSPRQPLGVEVDEPQRHAAFALALLHFRDHPQRRVLEVEHAAEV